MAKGTPDFPKISIVGPIQRCIKPGSMRFRNGKYPVCTKTRITYIGSTFPKLPFDIDIGLVQTRYHGER